jgi:hypothetical protein
MSVEVLKPLAEIGEPDSRNLLRVFVNNKTGAERRNTLKDMHDAVSGIVLDAKVPEDIRSQFAVGQNLAVYAWFYYRFYMNAELQALACIEYALRLKLNPQTPGEKNFKTMLRKAVREGLIKDQGFRFFPVMPNQGVRRLPTKTGEVIVNSYSELLVEILPPMRNNLAHGASTLFDGAPGMLRIAADIINQLFVGRVTAR